MSCSKWADSGSTPRSPATCPIPINLLRFDVFSAGSSDANRAIVAQEIGANDILTVNAGTYHIVSYFGDVNATVRADLRVEPGELTDVTLYHRAAQVSFKLVSEAGGEAIADVDWTVKTSDGTTVFDDTGAFPRRSCRKATTSSSPSAATRCSIASSRFNLASPARSRF